jgi:hypothetical protein
VFGSESAASTSRISLDRPTNGHLNRTCSA